MLMLIQATPRFITIWPAAREALCDQYVTDINPIDPYSCLKPSAGAIDVEYLHGPLVLIEQLQEPGAGAVGKLDLRRASADVRSGLGCVEAAQTEGLIHSADPDRVSVDEAAFLRAVPLAGLAHAPRFIVLGVGGNDRRREREQYEGEFFHLPEILG